MDSTRSFSSTGIAIRRRSSFGLTFILHSFPLLPISHHDPRFAFLPFLPLIVPFRMSILLFHFISTAWERPFVCSFASFEQFIYPSFTVSSRASRARSILRSLPLDSDFVNCASPSFVCISQCCDTTRERQSTTRQRINATRERKTIKRCYIMQFSNAGTNTCRSDPPSYQLPRPSLLLVRDISTLIQRH